MTWKRHKEDDYNQVWEHPQTGAKITRGRTSNLTDLPALVEWLELWQAANTDRGRMIEEVDKAAAAFGLRDGVLVDDIPKGFTVKYRLATMGDAVSDVRVLVHKKGVKVLSANNILCHRLQAALAKPPTPWGYSENPKGGWYVGDDYLITVRTHPCTNVAVSPRCVKREVVDALREFVDATKHHKPPEEPKRRLRYVFFSLPWKTQVAIAALLDLLPDNPPNDITLMQLMADAFEAAYASGLEYSLWAEAHARSLRYKYDPNPYQRPAAEPDPATTEASSKPPRTRKRPPFAIQCVRTVLQNGTVRFAKGDYVHVEDVATSSGLSFRVAAGHYRQFRVSTSGVADRYIRKMGAQLGVSAFVHFAAADMRDVDESKVPSVRPVAQSFVIRCVRDLVVNGTNKYVVGNYVRVVRDMCGDAKYSPVESSEAATRFRSRKQVGGYIIALADRFKVPPYDHFEIWEIMAIGDCIDG